METINIKFIIIIIYQKYRVEQKTLKQVKNYNYVRPNTKYIIKPLIFIAIIISLSYLDFAPYHTKFTMQSSTFYTHISSILTSILTKSNWYLFTHRFFFRPSSHSFSISLTTFLSSLLLFYPS